jgi:uncharacterized protein YndB with AHSA1/START domain
MTHNPITVVTTVVAPIETVWKYWNEPEHIVVWSTGSPDWHTPTATNDLRVGGQFNVRMEARDGSEGFNFVGTYTTIVPYERIEYVIEDGREVIVTFEVLPDGVVVTEMFDMEQINSEEFQRQGWQGILNNFKVYVESHQ